MAHWCWCVVLVRGIAANLSEIAQNWAHSTTASRVAFGMRPDQCGRRLAARRARPNYGQRSIRDGRSEKFIVEREEKRRVWDIRDGWKKRTVKERGWK